MPLAQLIETGQRVLEAPTASRRGDAEERIGDAAHRRDDDGGPPPIPRARVADNLNQSLNGFGIGDGRAAEFLDNHKEQILYGKAGVAAGLNADHRSRSSSSCVIRRSLRRDLVMISWYFLLSLCASARSRSNAAIVSSCSHGNGIRRSPIVSTAPTLITERRP